MTILTPTQINNVCLQVVNSTSDYNDYLHSCLHVMYITGCRCGEVANLNLWKHTNPNKVSWQTIKRGGIRSINTSELPSFYVNFIDNPPASGFISSKRNIRSAFDIFSPYQAIWTLDKQISSHLFRHNRMKQLYADGWSIDDITAWFAVGANEVSDYYINSVIYVP